MLVKAKDSGTREAGEEREEVTSSESSNRDNITQAFQEVVLVFPGLVLFGPDF